MKHHNVFWTSCAAHCIDLMFEAMGKRENVATVVKKARTSQIIFTITVGCWQRCVNFAKEKLFVQPPLDSPPTILH